MTIRVWDPRVARGASWVWLLEIQIGDAWMRFSDAPRDGAPSAVPGVGATRYAGGMDFNGEVPDGIDPFGDSPDEKRVEVTLDPPPGKTWAELAEAGIPLAAGRGLLSLWVEGEDDLMVFVDGVVKEPAYAGGGEPATFTLAEETDDDAGTFPPALARVTTTTWPNTTDKADGEPYPWVIGEPGDGVIFTAPAPFVDSVNNYLLIACGEVDAANVVVLNETTGSSATVAVQQQSDGLGNVVSYVDITAAGIGIDVDASYFTSWGGPNGGGMLNPDGSLMVGFGDVLRWMLSFSRKRIDRGRLAAALPFLNGFRMDTVIAADPESRFAPWDWIADHVLPLVPVSVRSGPDGIYPAVFRWDATASDAAVEIQATTADFGARGGVVHAERVSDVTWTPRGKVANELALSFAHDPVGDAFSGRRTLTGDPARASVDPVATMNLYCHNSRNSYRGPNGEPLTIVKEEETEVVWDRGTVASILAWWARRYALQARLVQYEVAADVVCNVEPGDVVLLSDAEMGWTRRVFVVEVQTWTDTGTSLLDLRAIEEPPRDRWTAPA